MQSREKWDSHNQAVFDYWPRWVSPMPWHLQAHEYRKTQAPLIWGDQDWWQNNHGTWRYHFAHMSNVDPSMVAYVQDDRKGEAGLYTRLKPGRYLTKFFSSVLTERRIKHYAEWANTGTLPKAFFTDYPLKFADTEDEIVRVYKHGPYSCMVGFSSNENPVRAWAGGDLAVAYLEGEAPKGQTDKSRTIVARAIVWPKKKIGSRLYPTRHYWERDGFESSTESECAQATLRDKLAALGYHFDTPREFIGAKLKRIPDPYNRGDFLCPALDMPLTAKRAAPRSKFLVLSDY